MDHIYALKSGRQMMWKMIQKERKIIILMEAQTIVCYSWDNSGFSSLFKRMIDNFIYTRLKYQSNIDS